MELLERDGERRVLETAIADSRSAGRVAVVAGEAGIGKTSLVAAVCGALTRRRVLWGACDPLITPRAMGPLRDVARQAGGPLLAALEGAGSREDLLAAALDELAAASVHRRRGPPLGRRRARSTSSRCSAAASCARPAA